MTKQLTITAADSQVNDALIALAGVPGVKVEDPESEQLFTHEFHVHPRSMIDTRWRSAQEWLHDLIGIAFPDHPVKECTAYQLTLPPPVSVVHDDVPYWIVTIESTLSVLTFCCVLFNQHAAQHPADATPESEALRFEASINEQRSKGVGVPACPSCGERRWKIDADVNVRTAIILTAERVEVLVDRAGGDAAEFSEAPEFAHDHITCEACDSKPGDELAHTLLIKKAEHVLANGETDWRVITDYRQF